MFTLLPLVEWLLQVATTIFNKRRAPRLTYHLPNSLQYWPWARAINPHLDEFHDESILWLAQFNAFDPDALASFKKGRFTLLTALGYPESSAFTFRSVCDLMNLFFAIDELTDDEPLDIVIQRCDATMDAILHPDIPRPNGENALGEMARQFWKRASDGEPMSAGVVQRFQTTWRQNLDSVIAQAERRGTHYICKPDEYIAARRDNIGTLPCFVWIEQCLGLDLPDAVMQHPLIKTLHENVSDMVFMTNDTCSYRKEVLANDCDYNMVTVIITHLDTDLPGAIQWISDYQDRSVQSFMRARQAIMERTEGTSQWSDEHHKQVLRYIDGLAVFVRGHDEWYFESRRYFGEKGEEVKRTRKVVIEQ
ncbi:terpenoid synthase [Cylindrobasidium torrendii FP15055 ss-10]|uniref:Terpene synthase n=1 Tax=Cylindrobasidium torrendii FP15055 ss-10 TaxID=1314674 RepID=A0A0D7BE20_9AGAR|nr:terpenoid synthase [Cylindrobasidium torrendii FP15055 ss-10]